MQNQSKQHYDPKTKTAYKNKVIFVKYAWKCVWCGTLNIEENKEYSPYTWETCSLCSAVNCLNPEEKE